MQCGKRAIGICRRLCARGIRLLETIILVQYIYNVLARSLHIPELLEGQEEG